VGCLFHFKQALRRRMEKLGIPEAEIKFAMRKGEVDLLTVIPIEDLERGIAFARTRIMQYIDEEPRENPPKGYKYDSEASAERWDIFWNEYFCG